MDDLLTALLGRNGDVFQDRLQRKAELARDIIASSYLTGEFTMSDGLSSTYIFHPSLFMTKPTVLRRLVSVLAALVPQRIDRLAGSEPGSLPIATGLALETGIPFIALREVPEAAPLSFAALGEVHAGERVVVVEDVVKSGSRALAAARAIERSGAIVDRVLCVIDREEGGSALLSEAGLLLEPLFTARELLVTPGRAPGSRGGR